MKLHISNRRINSGRTRIFRLSCLLLTAALLLSACAGLRRTPTPTPAATPVEPTRVAATPTDAASPA
ncbi:MAG: hypothetical protein WA089_14370, partial [Anaerolineae bacterium]